MITCEPSTGMKQWNSVMSPPKRNESFVRNEVSPDLSEFVILPNINEEALPFDALGWLQGIKADRSVMGGRSDGWGGNSDQSSDHLRNLGNYLKNDYKDASHALKADPAYIKRKNSKPKKHKEKEQLKEWFLRDQEATVDFVMSTVFPCQAVEVITTFPRPRRQKVTTCWRGCIGRMSPRKTGERWNSKRKKRTPKNQRTMTKRIHRTMRTSFRDTRPPSYISVDHFFNHFHEYYAWFMTSTKVLQ